MGFLRKPYLKAADYKCQECGVPDRKTVLRSGDNIRVFLFWDEQRQCYTKPDGEWVGIRDSVETLPEFENSKEEVIKLSVTHKRVLCPRCKRFFLRPYNRRRQSYRRRLARESKTGQQRLFDWERV